MVDELPVSEVVRARKRVADVELCDAAGERAEGLDPVHEHVHVPVAPFEAALREQQRLGANERAVALIHRRRDDQVHLPVLVLQQHEDDTLRRRRALPRNRHPRHAHATAVPALRELGKAMAQAASLAA